MSAGLTDDELHVMDLLAEVATVMATKVIGRGRTRDGDLNEMAVRVHGLQHMVMAQAAARAHPELFRLLGETVG